MTILLMSVRDEKIFFLSKFKEQGILFENVSKSINRSIFGNCFNRNK